MRRQSLEWLEPSPESRPGFLARLWQVPSEPDIDSDERRILTSNAYYNPMNIKPEAVFFSLKARFVVSGRVWLTNKRLIFRANGRQFGSIGSTTEWEVTLGEVRGVSMPPPGRPSQRGILDIYLKDNTKHSLQFQTARPWVDAINHLLFPDASAVT